MDAPNSPPAAAPSVSSTPSKTVTPTPKSTPTPTKTLTSTGIESPQEAPAPSAPEKRKYKLKVDGQEFEEELSDDDITTRLQKARAADRRMQESAQLKKQVQEFIETIKNDPFEALKDPLFGLDLNKLAEDRLIKEYQERLLPAPEQENLKLQRELELREKKIKEFEDQHKTRERTELEAKIQGEMEQSFVSALESSDLPKTRETIRMMAEVASINLEHGIELTPQQMAQEVKHRISEMHQFVTRSLKGESLIKHLGEDVVKEVLRHSVEKVRGSNPYQKPVAELKADKEITKENIFKKEKPERQMSSTERWRKLIRE